MTESGRRLVGDFVRDEMARQGLSQDAAAKRAGFARDTISRVIRGDVAISAITLRRVEGALNLPRYLLDYIERGDAERIAKVDMDPDLKRSVLDMVA